MSKAISASTLKLKFKLSLAKKKMREQVCEIVRVRVSLWEHDCVKELVCERGKSEGVREEGVREERVSVCERGE